MHMFWLGFATRQGFVKVATWLAENDGMAPDTQQAEPPATHKASLAEVIRAYEANHGVSVSQVGKAATQLGFMDKLEADLRGALIDGHPIRNWSTYVFLISDEVQPFAMCVQPVAA